VNVLGAALGLHALAWAGLDRLHVPPPTARTYVVEPVLLPAREPATPIPEAGPEARPARRAAAPPRPRRAAPRASSPIASVAKVAIDPAPPRRIEPTEPPPPGSDAAVLLGAITRAGANDAGIDGGLGNPDGEGAAAARGSSFLRGGARGAAAPPHESRAAPARPVEDYTRLTPPYSSEAIEHDVSASVSLRVEVDEQGRVVAASILKGAGYGLDEIAVKTIKGYRFTPARDDHGRPVRAVFGWRMVWESHWKKLVTKTIAGRPNCRGQGPMNLGEIHPVYIDCDGSPGYFELERSDPR
jgi:protein TonB